MNDKPELTRREQITQIHATLESWTGRFLVSKIEELKAEAMKSAVNLDATQARRDGAAGAIEAMDMILAILPDRAHFSEAEIRKEGSRRPGRKKGTSAK